MAISVDKGGAMADRDPAVTVRLPAELVEWLRAESKRSGMPQNQIIEKALRAFMARWERAMGVLLEEEDQ
jgi:predicted DNA binding CopG/RHH family protein